MIMENNIIVKWENGDHALPPAKQDSAQSLTAVNDVSNNGHHGAPFSISGADQSQQVVENNSHSDLSTTDFSIYDLDEPTIVEPVTTTQTSANLISADSADGADPEAKKQKQADLLAELVKERAEFFQTAEGVVVAVINVDGHKECHKLNSGTFSDWLTSIYYERTQSIPGAQAKADAKALFSFLATKQQREAFYRVGHHMGKFYLDLGTPEWNAVEIDAHGWRIVERPPVNFVRSKKMKPLPLPTHSSDLKLLLQYINIEQEDWLLVAAWVVAALYPRGPYPILILAGQAGSAKSTTLKVLKAIIDPTGAALQGKINDERNLFVSASNSWLLALDNVSYISPEMSDAYCRLSTGGGYTHRQLHTDGDEYVIDVMRPVAINGIGEIATQQDMADRAIIITPPAISEDERRDEETFWAEFEQDKSQILGAMLNALATAIRRRPDVKLPKMPRMADFARIGVAAEPAFQDSEYKFLNLYEENREAIQETIVENSKVADVLRRMMATTTSWAGRPTELLEKLNNLADEKERDASWPKNAAKLTEKLQRVAPALQKVGISAMRSRGNGNNKWTITKRHIE